MTEEKRGKKRKKNGEKKRREKTDENSGHYVIAISGPPERRTLVPKKDFGLMCYGSISDDVFMRGFSFTDMEEGEGLLNLENIIM